MLRHRISLLLLFATALAACIPGFCAQPLAVTFHSFSGSADFTAAGAIFEGTRLTKAGDAITYGSSVGSINYSDSYGSPARTYSYARWTSPWFNAGINFSELVSSWNAATPPGTWIQMEMQASPDNVYTTKWFVMGRWSFSDGDIHRTSLGGQGDADGFVAIDTFFAKDHPLTAYRLRVTLYKLAGSAAGPAVGSVGAVASDMPNAKPYVPSPLGGAEGIELAVPRYSQEIH